MVCGVGLPIIDIETAAAEGSLAQSFDKRPLVGH